MANYLAIPVKSTAEVDLVKPLKKFIGTTFSQIKLEDYERSLTEFQRLRTQACNKFLDKHESAIEAVSRYYDQLCAVETKLPITEDQVRLNFKWYDAFDKGSLLSGRASLTIPLGTYEKACLLYNIAAIQSQVASVQSKDTDEGLKLSAKLFQQSAGLLKHLKDHVMSYLGRDPTPDLHPDTVGALSSLMLAQAQESIYQKSAVDKMKDAVVAKLAMSCADYYAEALKLLQLYSVKDIWPKEWISVVAGKQAAYHALAEYYQSGVAKVSKTYGEEIARLQHAKELTQAAITRSSRELDFSNQLSKIEAALQAARKDNDFIYHDKVPDFKSLPSVGKAPVAKPLSLPERLSTNFQDLFEKLVPIAVHAALSAYEAKKNQLINNEVTRLREATQTMNGILASLNLPAAIEDVSGTEVPASLKEKAGHIQEIGGIAVLNQLISELPESLSRNKEILDEAIRMLDEEAASDFQLKEEFKEKWTRTPSIKLTEGIRTEGSKYQSILDNAISADRVVKEKYNAHRTGFELLSKPISELQAALPASSPVVALKGSAAVMELRQLMKSVDEIKAERTVMENELRTTVSDMTSKFMNALMADGAVDEQGLSDAELERVYGPLKQQVSTSLASQEQLLNKVQTANTQFCQQKMSDQSGARREAMLRDIAGAYDAFIELKGNLEEGTKFYNDLTQILVKYQNKISDLCFARKTEKEELLKDLNAQIARRPAETTPSVPNYQKPKPAPSRPPPPVPTTSSSVAGSSHSAAPTVHTQPSSASAPPTVAASAPSAPPSTAAPATMPMPTPQIPASNQPLYAGGAPYPTQPYAAQYPPMPTGYNPYAVPYGQPIYYPGQPVYPQQQFQQQAGQGQSGYPTQGHPSYPAQGYAPPPYGYPPAPPGQVPYQGYH